MSDSLLLRLCNPPAVLSPLLFASDSGPADVLRWCREAHDPTCGMGRGSDRGTQHQAPLFALSASFPPGALSGRK